MVKFARLPVEFEQFPAAREPQDPVTVFEGGDDHIFIDAVRIAGFMRVTPKQKRLSGKPVGPIATRSDPDSALAVFEQCCDFI